MAADRPMQVGMIGAGPDGIQPGPAADARRPPLRRLRPQPRRSEVDGDRGRDRGHVADAETTPLREPEAYQYDIDVAEVAEVWRRGSVVGSWLVDLIADAFARSPDLDGFAGRSRTPEKADGQCSHRWTRGFRRRSSRRHCMGGSSRDGPESSRTRSCLRCAANSVVTPKRHGRAATCTTSSKLWPTPGLWPRPGRRSSPRAPVPGWRPAAASTSPSAAATPRGRCSPSWPRRPFSAPPPWRLRRAGGQQAPALAGDHAGPAGSADYAEASNGG